MNNLNVVEAKGIRVLTTRQIAGAYQVKEKQINQNFKNNKGRFIEGKHYIALTGDELRSFKNHFENFDVVAKHTSQIYLWTEKGALLHAKSLNTDKAWEVYDYLVDFYFRFKEQRGEETSELEKKVVNVLENAEMQNAIQDVKRYNTALDVAIEELNRYQSEERFEKIRWYLNVLGIRLNGKLVNLMGVDYSMVTNERQRLSLNDYRHIKKG